MVAHRESSLMVSTEDSSRIMNMIVDRTCQSFSGVFLFETVQVYWSLPKLYRLRYELGRNIGKFR